MMLYLHIYHFSQISTPLFRPLPCAYVYYIDVGCCTALLNLCLPRSVHMASKCIIKSYIYSNMNIEFILPATEHSWWNVGFLFPLTTNTFVVQIFCPFKK